MKTSISRLSFKNEFARLLLWAVKERVSLTRQIFVLLTSFACAFFDFKSPVMKSQVLPMRKR